MPPDVDYKTLMLLRSARTPWPSASSGSNGLYCSQYQPHRISIGSSCSKLVALCPVSMSRPAFDFLPFLVLARMLDNEGIWPSF